MSACGAYGGRLRLRKISSQLRLNIQDEIATALVMTVKIVARYEHRKDDKGSAEIFSW